MTRVVLHIGAPKTGTSFIQSVLSNNASLRSGRGVLWPGTVWSDQVRAVEDLRDAAAGKIDEATRWDALVDEVRKSDASTAVISMEWLCFGDARMAARAMKPFADHDVRVVLTLRDLARAIPAQWQESTQNGFAWTYRHFVTDLMESKQRQGRAGRHFWVNQDWARMVETWSPIARGNFWVVTVPPAGAPSSLLWSRFCEAAGIDPAGYSLDGWPNESLGATSAELMRRLSAARKADGRNPRHRGALKHRLAKQTLAHHRRQEPSLVLAPELYDWTVERTQQLVRKVTKSRPRVVGDLDDLVPAPIVLKPGVVTDPAAIEDAELLDAAMYGLLGLTRPKKPGA